MSFEVDQQSAAVAEMARRWPMIDALVGGTGAMRQAGTLFLPQFPAEPDGAYRTRLATATLFPAFSRTAEVLAAKPMAKPIGVTGVPPQVASLFDDVDGEGGTLHAFAAGLLLSCLHYGLAGVLVDYPPLDGVRTRADERAVGARPYFAAYPAAAILGWRAARGRLLQLRLLETVTEPDGPFGEVAVRQVRVLTPGAWQLWRTTPLPDGRERWAVWRQGTTSLAVIPFVFFYGLREGFGIGRPPLTDLAFLNVEHWQSSSDQQTILHTARVPILFAKGLNDSDPIVFGASTAIKTNAENAEVMFVEHSGAAIAAGRQSLLDLEDRMRQTGAELLVQQPGQVTATQTISEGESSRSILQRIVESFEEGLEAAIALMAAWLGQPAQAEVSLFKDFGAAALSGPSSSILIEAADKGYVSPETVFKGLQRRDIVPADLDWQEEQARIAAGQSIAAAHAA